MSWTRICDGCGRTFGRDKVRRGACEECRAAAERPAQEPPAPTPEPEAPEPETATLPEPPRPCGPDCSAFALADELRRHRPAARNGRSEWSDADMLAALHLMEAHGLSAEKVARRLGFPRNGVLGLKKRVLDAHETASAGDPDPGRHDETVSWAWIENGLRAQERQEEAA